jgi:hypothetical protein
VLRGNNQTAMKSDSAASQSSHGSLDVKIAFKVSGENA